MGNILEGCGVPREEADTSKLAKKTGGSTVLRHPSKESATKPTKPAKVPYVENEIYRALEQEYPDNWIPFENLNRTESVGASSGIGMVFKATYSTTGALVAAKRMPMPMLGGDRLDIPYLNEMAAEGRKLAHLKHQNVMCLHGMSVYRSERSGRYDLYLVMELMACSFNQVFMLLFKKVVSKNQNTAS